MLKKLLLALCVGGLALGTAAASAADAKVDPAAEQVVRQAVSKLGPDISIDMLQPSPLPGFYQVIAGGQMIYVSSDGKYVLNGDMLDLSQHKNLNDDAWSGFRKAELAKVPASDRIIYAPPNPKYTVTIFTDVNCGFCRALHQHMDAFNQAGIAVEYLAWPREGLQTTSGRPTKTYTEMVSVWCSADRKAAFDQAKDGHPPKATNCKNPVKSEFDLGLKLGVNGTPMIIGPNGRSLGGYVTPDQLLQALQQGG